MTISAICQNNLYAQSGRMCYNYTHSLEECATTTRTIWQNVLQLHAQSGRMSIIGEGIGLCEVVFINSYLVQVATYRKLVIFSVHGPCL